jgi:hypothetical protein
LGNNIIEIVSKRSITLKHELEITENIFFKKVLLSKDVVKCSWCDVGRFEKEICCKKTSEGISLLFLF